MEDLKKKYYEIVALCKFEKDIRDIYAEGNTDKVFLENFLKNKRCNRKVVSIDMVDFSELSSDYLEGLDIKSNRNKLVILSKLLNEKTPLTPVRCIVDKDFDDYIESLSNNKLLKTDFSCLESYLFCEEVIEKFLKIGISNFPFQASFILDQLAGVLKSLFCLRLLREFNFPSTKLVEIDGNLAIDKTKGVINFNEKDYLNKFIHKNSLSKLGTNFFELYDALFQRLNIEIRNNINGHDFFDILFLYVNKIKNTQKFKEENFSRTLFLTVETPMIEKYNLFKSIISA